MASCGNGWQLLGCLSLQAANDSCPDTASLVRNRWSIEHSWHWPRVTQLKEDDCRYREPNGGRILPTLRRLAMNALRLGDCWSIAEGLAALAHDIKGLLALLVC